MKEIEISSPLREAAPDLKLAVIAADVVNGPTSDALWSEIEQASDDIKARYEISDIAKRPAIAATRAAYKALGKEPNRYRPSAEALCRRIVQGKGLYRLSTLIDVINLVSIKSGYSIGGFDADKIAGDKLVLGRGQEGEVFNAIGRGQLNIDGLPVYRDAVGGIGTPTSDEERTKLQESTQRLLIIINCYGEEMPLREAADYAVGLLREYAQVSNPEVEIYL